MTDLPWLPEVLYGGPIELDCPELTWEEVASKSARAIVRNDALEEAALVADYYWSHVIAKTIRDLKDKGA